MSASTATYERMRDRIAALEADCEEFKRRIEHLVEECTARTAQKMALEADRDSWKILADKANNRATTLEAELAEARELAERLKREAQIHAMEARTQRATVQEIYQVLTGATGEPGDWSGAEPARQVMAKLARFEAVVERVSKILGDDDWWEEVDLQPYEGDAQSALKDELDTLLDAAKELVE